MDGRHTDLRTDRQTDGRKEGHIGKKLTTRTCSAELKRIFVNSKFNVCLKLHNCRSKVEVFQI